jgi:hypothetical protein
MRGFWYPMQAVYTANSKLILLRHGFSGRDGWPGRRHQLPGIRTTSAKDPFLLAADCALHALERLRSFFFGRCSPTFGKDVILNSARACQRRIPAWCRSTVRVGNKIDSLQDTGKRGLKV